MALKFEISAEEHAALPEVVQSEYKPTEAGAFALVVEGLGTVEEFRANNIALRREKDTLTQQIAGLTAKVGEFETKYKDVDPEQYRTLVGAVKGAGVKDPKDIAGIMGTVQELRASVQTLQQTIQQRDEQVAAERQRAADVALDSDLRKKVLALGVTEIGSAADVAVSRIRQHFELDADGRSAKVKAGAFDPTTGNALTPEVLIAGLKQTESYLFKPSTGAPGGDFGNSRTAAAPNGVQSPVLVGGVKTLINPNNQTFIHYAEQIGRGEIVVQKD
jgi:hypothetical protein